MKLLVSEVLTRANKVAKREDRIAFLQEHDSPALRDIIRIAYDDDVVSLLPKGAPPYKPDDAPEGHAPSSLYKEFRQFKYFFKGAIGEKLKEMKRDTLFVQLLESIHASEAKLLIRAKDKDMKNIPGVTKKLCQEAFPGLIAK